MINKHSSTITQKWSNLALPIKVSIFISTLGFITGLAYIAYSRYAISPQIAEIDSQPTHYCRSSADCPPNYSCQPSVKVQCLSWNCPAPRKVCKPDLSKTSSPKPTPSSSPSAKTVTLDASPPPTNLFLGQSKIVNINAHVNNDHLTAVELDLRYNPQHLKLSNLNPTDYLPNILAQPTYQPGIITATYGAPAESGGKTDWGTVAHLTITPLTTGSSTIQFGPNTIASATSSNNNVLNTPSPITINVFYSSDINVDGVINIFDYNKFITEYGKEGYSPANFNGDNIVDIFDYNIFVANYGSTSK